MTTKPTLDRRSIAGSVVLLALMAFIVLWTYWPVLAEMAQRWGRDPRYSHGFLVPLFSLYLLWDRLPAADRRCGRSTWWGLLPVLAGAILMLSGGRFFVEWLSGVSLIPTLVGLVLLTGGWPLLRWTWPAIVFVFFMVPLPYQLEVAVGYPLQRVGTLCSNYVLQTAGFNAVAEGNVIVLDRARIGVVEACNGLGMIFMFSAFTCGAALVLERPIVDRAAVILSTLPIALGANVLRITATAVLSETVGGKIADAVYHDLAGWLMMPVALGSVWLELLLLSRLFVAKPSRSSAPLVNIAEMRPAAIAAGQRRA